MLGEPLPDRFEPRIAVVVVEGSAGSHLGDVGRWMKVVGVGERHPQALRQRCADGRLTGARHSMTTIGDAIPSTYPVVLDVTQHA